MVYATNDADMIAQLADMGLNTEYWSDEPMKIKMGSTSIITGLEKSLLGCREGDVVEVYMTSKVAYDDKSVGVVLRDMSVMWSFTITSVTK
jgi:FKBP-type peptidyl-prolyl cis-trans isomerase 2